MAAFFAAHHGTSAPQGYNIAPSQPVLAVRFNPKTGVRTLDDLQWGLVPFFAKDTKIAWKTINARAETVDTMPSYRQAFQKRRCLIVADGFFEWKALPRVGKGARKQPYAIALEDRRPFALAGLWEGWQDPETGEWLRTCSIVTTEASPQMRALHDRMPVILHRDDYGAWLGEEHAPPSELKALLRPWSGQLAIWPVSTQMNSPGKGFDGPEVLDELKDAPNSE